MAFFLVMSRGICGGSSDIRESARTGRGGAATVEGKYIGTGGMGGGGGDDRAEGKGAEAAATVDQEKEAELEQRRRDRAAQALEK